MEFMDINEGRKDRITVGIPTERGGYMLPGILTRFKKEFPRIEVSVLGGSSELLSGFACYRKDAYLDKTQRRFITIAQELWA